MKSRFKHAIDQGLPCLGAQLRLGCPAIAEMFAKAGFDWIAIDCEHAPQTPTSVQAQLQAIDGTGATPIVRPRLNDRSLFKLYLDMGAMGLLVPEIETPEQAEQGAKACRYPPRGNRGAGPSRAADYGLNPDYLEQADDLIVYIPIIESAPGVQNVDAIVKVDGVDAVAVGSFDLSYSLGVPGQIKHPVVLDAKQRIFEAAAEAGKPVVVPTPRAELDSCRDHLAAGRHIFLADGDEWILAEVCQRTVETFRENSKPDR